MSPGRMIVYEMLRDSDFDSLDKALVLLRLNFDKSSYFLTGKNLIEI